MALVLVVAGVLAWPHYRAFRRDRATRSALGYFQEGNYRSAYLVADDLVRRDPGNFAARRVLARVLEPYAPADALNEWETLVRLEPGNPENLAGCAAAQIRARNADAAAVTLELWTRAGAVGADYHRMRAALALLRADEILLRRALEDWASAEPDSAEARFGLAALKLRSKDPTQLREARSALEEFARGDRMRIRATLALLADAPLRWPDAAGPGNHAARLAQQLYWRDVPARPMDLPQPKGWVARDFGDLVEHMKQESAPAPEDVARLVDWMIQHGQAREALLWLESRELHLGRSPEIIRVKIACLTQLGAWPRLEQLLLAGAWGVVSPEVVRQAFRARESEANSNQAEALRHWANTYRLAENSDVDLRVLQRLAQLWRWPAERQMQILWALVRHAPGDRLAWQMLSEQAQSTRDAAKMWRVYSSWIAADPDNRRAQVERVILGLLTRGQDPELAAVAAELFHSAPQLPAVRVAKALADWRAGRSEAALVVLDGEPLNYRAEPRFALARGLVLASAGRNAEAAAMFDLVPAGALLPEEEALIAAAKSRAS